MTVDSGSAESNPYGITLYPVRTASGSDLHLQTQQEADWYNDRRDRYLEDHRFTNVSDLQDLDRLLMLEVLVYRWGLWMAQGFDYLFARVDEGALKNSIREYCVSDDTEALTDRGWKTLMELTPGDQVLTFNPDTRVSEWQPIQRLHTYVPTHPLVSIEKREISALVSKVHRWYVQRDTKARSSASPYEWRTTEELDQYCWVPTAAPHAAPKVPVHQDAFVELVAWWWTEGYCDKKGHNGEIQQSVTANPAKVESIRLALKGYAGDSVANLKKEPHGRWSEKPSRSNGMVNFSISTGLVRELEEAAPQRHLSPAFIKSLTSHQLELLVETSVRGDGWKPQEGSWCISQRHKSQLDSFQMAAVLAGYRANVRFASSINMWTMALSKKDRSRPLWNTTPKEVEYSGLIWCPQVANGTWLARRNGTMYFTGNSVELRQLKTLLGIDKASRDKDKGESLADYTTNLLERAKVFGYHRNEQYELVVTKFYELRSMILTHDRCDEDERKLLDLSHESIIQWIRDKVIAPFDEHSEAFRKEQSIWIRSM